VISLQVPLDLKIAEKSLEVSHHYGESQNLSTVGLLHRFEIPKQEVVRQAVDTSRL
jgi:hypothetical protein